MQTNGANYCKPTRRMDFQDKFVQVLYNLIPVLQVSSGQLSRLLAEDVHLLPKGIGVPELTPVVEFELGPFESPDDHFYRDRSYMKAVNLMNKKIRDRVVGLKERKRSDGKKTGNRAIPDRKDDTGSTESGKQKNQAKRIHSGPGGDTPPQTAQDVLLQLAAIKSEMKNFKTLSELLTNLKAEVHKMETALTVEPFENLLKILEKTFSPDQNRNYVKPGTGTGNIFNGFNNITYNNRYQIENVFAINRLTDRMESRLKEADAEIINELTAHKMNEVLEKAVNNLKGDGVPRGDFPAAEQLSLQQNEVELLDQLQKNFSRLFSHRNVSLHQMNQMSKIIDFVERYHGAVGSLKPHSDWRGRKGDGRRKKVGGGQGVVQGSRWKQRAEGKVLCCDGGLDFFDGEDEKYRPAVRRKGGVK